MGFPGEWEVTIQDSSISNYNPTNDLLINDSCAAKKRNYFYNDPSYPQPTGITFTEPVKNYGPDADKFRDPATGLIKDASDLGTYITSFTPHRSPLGLEFDVKGKLAAPYYHSAFMMCYQEGTSDSSGIVGSGIGPFCDTSHDLLQLALFKDTTTGIYSMNCYRIGSSFKDPVDAYLDNNILYLLESHTDTLLPKAKLYALTFPLNTGNNSCPFLGNDRTICKGTSVTLTPNLKGQFTYQWSTGATTSQITVSPTTTISYWVKANNGIIASTDTINVAVKSPPAATNTPTGPTTFCSGTNPLTLTANAGSFSYNWKKGSNYISGANSQTYIPTSTGTYKVEVKNSSGCTKLSAGIAVTMNPLPTATITALGSTTFCAGGSVVLQANAGTGLSYQWKKGANNISGATLQNYSATSAATYKVIVTNANVCSKASSGKTITINCREAETLLVETSSNAILIYPNPAKDELHIDCAVTKGTATLIIKNILGQEIYRKTVEATDDGLADDINIKELNEGIYVLSVYAGGEIYSGKFIKE